MLKAKQLCYKKKYLQLTKYSINVYYEAISSFTNSNFIVEKQEKRLEIPLYTMLTLNPHCKLIDLLLFKTRQLRKKMNSLYR